MSHIYRRCALCLAWLLAPNACSDDENKPGDTLLGNNGDSGELQWSIGTSTTQFAVGQNVPLDIKVELQEVLTNCDSGQSCNMTPETCPGETYFISLSSTESDVSCKGAKCKISSIEEQAQSLRLTVQGLEAGRVNIEAHVKDKNTGKRYHGTAHLDFVKPNALRFLHHPYTSVGATRPILTGSYLTWCVSVENGDSTLLWAEAPAPQFSVENDEIKLLGEPFFENVATPYPTPDLATRYLCQSFQPQKPGKRSVFVKFDSLQQTQELNVVEVDQVRDLEIRKLFVTGSSVDALPLWQSVNEDGELKRSAPLDRISLETGHGMGLFQAELLLENGDLVWGGVGAMTVGPTGTAALVDAAIQPEFQRDHLELSSKVKQDENAPLVTHSLFFIAPMSPGTANLEFSLGQVVKTLPITVTQPSTLSTGSAAANLDADASTIAASDLDAGN